MNNLMILTDSYKVSHYKQYPPKTQYVYSYLESRQSKQTVFFGLQYIIQKYLTQPLTLKDLEEASDFWKIHFGSYEIFNYEGWKELITRHKGYMPVCIKAVKEGSVINGNNVLMTIENTDPDFPWITNWLETLLMQVWYPCTVATQSYEMKKIILDFLDKTGDTSLIDFKLHDFGFRGSTSVESSAIGGAAHLVNFLGTDTASAIILLKDYYAEPMGGYSIPAAEHSTITSWGRDKELDAYRNMLQQYPQGLVAVVSDSYNIFEACGKLWGVELHDEVINRDGCLVIRPDSGDPLQVLPKIFGILGEKFGFEKNSKGYKVLNPKIRVIQGDGIDKDSIGPILNFLKMKDWSADNITFGSGGGLLQKLNRDTYKYAIKCSSVVIDNMDHDVRKNPITDLGKSSKAGRLALHQLPSGEYITTKSLNNNSGLLEMVYLNGQLVRQQSLKEIRNLVKGTL